MTAPTEQTTETAVVVSTPKKPRTTRSAVATTKATKRPGATETAVAVKKEQPTAAPTTKREVADEKTRKSVAIRLMRVKETGWTRPMLAELAFGSADAHYPVWRFQEVTRGGYVEHVDAIETALTNIETGLAKLPERAPRTTPAGPSKAELTAQLARLTRNIESVRSLADTIFQKKATAAEKKLAQSVLNLLDVE
ncbi:hypothetical protein [Amycolatopsis sp. WQ 127309]|uniref:hypothetical protein n=1 Tax=Amycolatopsis sp. WQ 127309 TaxID=2932773 RepID=UPI001FF45A7F|nr:hypothetical protein [Amycolatopsis sp. WQ 127309]UOZ10553.1 hypothetical protein MUY22_20720 [Amycolatopsis sp. WQ 127309]